MTEPSSQADEGESEIEGETDTRAEPAGRPFTGLVLAVACVGFLVWSLLLPEAKGTIETRLRALRNVDPVVRRETARELCDTRRFAISLTIPALARAMADRDLEVRAEVIHSLGMLGADAIRRGDRAGRDAAAAPVLAALNNPDDRTRCDALGTVALLLRTGDNPVASTPGGPWPADRPALVVRIGALLDHPTLSIRAAADACLASIPDDLDPVLPTLLNAAARDPELKAMARRRWVLTALGRARPTVAAVPCLVAALQEPEPRVRALAATLLARVGPAASTAIPALLDVIGEPPAPDGQDDPAAAAAGALARIAPGSPAANEVMLALGGLRPGGDGPRGRAFAEALYWFGPGGERVPRGSEAARSPEPLDPSAGSSRYRR